MQPVWIMGEMTVVESVAAYGAHLQCAYQFQPNPSTNSIPVRLLNLDYGMLYTVEAEAGVLVNTARLEGICAYTRLPRELYLLTISMLGMLQYRAMEQNREFREEDFLHRDHPWCLYARPIPIEDAPLVFEHPRVCHGCWRFYSRICPPHEVQAARTVLDHASRTVALALAPSKVS